MMMPIRLVTLLIAVSMFPPAAVPEQTATEFGDDVQIPLPIAGILGTIEFDARVGITVSAGRVSEAMVTAPAASESANARRVIRDATEAYVSSWKVNSDRTLPFETTVRVRHDRDRIRCSNNENFSVIAVPPGLVEFVTRPTTVCDPRVQMVVADPRTVREITGIVRCNCSGRRPVEGAVITITAADGFHREVRSDGNGRFRAGSLRPGQYEVEVSAPGFRELWRTAVTVDPQRPGASFDVRLKPDEALPAAPFVPAVVSHAILAIYPREARKAGADGVVRLRLSMENARVVDVDAEAAHPLLLRSAIDNVSTWQFASSAVAVLPVTYTYRLLPGDCSADQRPTIAMHFPDRVEITAKRLIRCNP